MFYDMIKEVIKVTEKIDFTKEELSKIIQNYILENTTEEGIDLSKLYFARLKYRNAETDGIAKIFGLQCPRNEENDPSKLAIVYIYKSQSSLDHVYIDIFNNTLLQSTCFSKDGMFTFVQTLRGGVTVMETFNMKVVLGKDRISADELNKIKDKINNIDVEEILAMSNDEFAQICLNDDLSKTNKS